MAMLIRLPKCVAPSVEYLITPAMTSNVSPSGVCSASSIYNSGYDAWYAMDQIMTSMWISALSGPPFHLQYQFDTAIRISSYSISSRWNASGQGPMDFQLQASNNGSSWTTIDTQTNQHMTPNVEYRHSVDSLVTYLYYRVYITEGEHPNVCSITEFKLYSLTPPP